MQPLLTTDPFEDWWQSSPRQCRNGLESIMYEPEPEFSPHADPANLLVVKLWTGDERLVDRLHIAEPCDNLRNYHADGTPYFEAYSDRPQGYQGESISVHRSNIVEIDGHVYFDYPKFKLIHNQTMMVDGEILYRIVAARDFGVVKAGDRWLHPPLALPQPRRSRLGKARRQDSVQRRGRRQPGRHR